MKQLIELVVVATVFSATVFAASSAQAQTTVNVHMNNLGGMISAPDLPIFIADSDTPVCVIKEEGHCTFTVTSGQGVKIQFGSRMSLRNTYVSSAKLDFVDGATQNYVLEAPTGANKARSFANNFGLIGVVLGAGAASAIDAESEVKGPVNLLNTTNNYYVLLAK